MFEHNEKEFSEECAKSNVEFLLPNPTPSSTLPTLSGFYWWRKSDADKWRMVQVVDFGDDRLMSYDVQHRNWSGRSLKGWAEHFPIGDWIAVPTP